MLENPGQGLQSSRAVSDQVAGYLADTGHGLLMQPSGLNTAQSLALRAGVPSATVFRDFDGSGQDPRVMRRFLDQAAFKARQEGAVIMLGRLRADTVSALLLWGLQDRAGSVALVPVSTVLRESVATE
ncbi:yibQ protein [Salipiger mucosus DSM 16094]|uniref:YibQ protein n=1 Tax=Salipiger mucosus DSM 16094 TaxID=1123237 RepID=S9RJ56_9RHOB|nr:yibQ protein [Salipiger mucosus DSM 16094]